jgi:hypothetical protein
MLKNKIKKNIKNHLNQPTKLMTWVMRQKKPSYNTNQNKIMKPNS